MKVIQINDEIIHTGIENVDLESKDMYWVTANPEELESNKDVFGFHSLTIHECFDNKQNARIEFYDTYNFMVLNIIDFKNSIVSSNELDVFVGSNFIVTVTKNDVTLLDELEHELINFRQNVIFNSDRSIIKILYYVMDKIIFNNYEIISLLENQADGIEIKILKNPDKKYLNELIHLRRQVHRFRNYITPLRYVGDGLICNDNHIIGQDYCKYFEQISNRIEKLINSVDSLVQYLVLVREAFEAEIANKTNELMKVFTIIATIFLPLTLITGIFGMNFEHNVLLNCAWGFYAILGAMLTIGVCLFILFKRKKWL